MRVWEKLFYLYLDILVVLHPVTHNGSRRMYLAGLRLCANSSVFYHVLSVPFLKLLTVFDIFITPRFDNSVREKISSWFQPRCLRLPIYPPPPPCWRKEIYCIGKDLKSKIWKKSTSVTRQLTKSHIFAMKPRPGSGSRSGFKAKPVAKFKVPEWGTCSLCSLAGRYDNRMPESTFSPLSGTKNLATGFKPQIRQSRWIRIQYSLDPKHLGLSTVPESSETHPMFDRERARRRTVGWPTRAAAPWLWGSWSWGRGRWGCWWPARWWWWGSAPPTAGTGSQPWDNHYNLY